MCYQIGKIYRGDGNFTMGDGVAAAGVIGVAGIAGQMAALEALNWVPFAGWAVKAAVAGSVIKGMGELIIAHFERAEPG